MKVVAFNGSVHQNGNTNYAIETIAKELRLEAIEVEILTIGKEEILGCKACNACFKTRNEECIIKTDKVNDYIQKIKEADGVILGSPVHYTGISATMKSFLDRAFYVAGANNSLFRHKVGVSVVAVRRTGGIAT
ncbi:MAG: flavodoxin family protein, partial [Filifactoraceae bacterium]